ncbi:MAG: oligosaccharide flippase family protein [Candidatus Stahlbacteria bacterium]|nr:oligosaccharide flippase family protein [Candidatus Stahlbacteria bacterium]
MSTQDIGTLHRVIKNFSSQAIAEIATKILGFIAVIYLARVFGPKDFGKISFAYAIVTYFMLITDLGLQTLGTREIARVKTELYNYTNNIITLRLLLGILSFVLLILSVFLFNKPLEIKLLIISYGLILIPSALFFEWIFRGIERMEFIGIAKVLDKACYLFLVIFWVKKVNQLLLVPYFWWAGNVVGSIFLLYIFTKNFKFPRLEFNPIFWVGLLKKSIPLGLAWLMIQISFNFDSVMLGFMKGEREVGLYSAAYKIILFVFMLGGAYIIAIFPVISRYYKESYERLCNLLSRSAKLMLTIGIPIAVGGTLIGKQIIHIFYGPEYQEGAVAFQILVWYITISFIAMVYSNSLIACDREKEYSIGVALMAGTNLILNAILIPRFSLVGAAVATVVAEGVLFIYSYQRFNKIGKISFVNYIWRPTFSAILMGSFIFLSPIKSLFLIIPISICIYLGGLFVCKGISLEEITFIKRALLDKG